MNFKLFKSTARFTNILFFGDRPSISWPHSNTKFYSHIKLDETIAWLVLAIAVGTPILSIPASAWFSGHPYNTSPSTLWGLVGISCIFCGSAFTIGFLAHKRFILLPGENYPLTPSIIAVYLLLFIPSGFLLFLGTWAQKGPIHMGNSHTPLVFIAIYSAYFLSTTSVFLVAGFTIVLFILGNFLLHDSWWHPHHTAGYIIQVFWFSSFFLLAKSARQARETEEKASRELSKTNDQLWNQAVQAEKLARMKERNYLAQEIHDSLGHYLTAAIMQLEIVKIAPTKDSKSTKKPLQKARSHVQKGLDELRHSITAFRFFPLEGKDLLKGLRQLTNEFSGTNLQCTLETKSTLQRLSPTLDAMIYRTVQEALTNIHRHSQATQTQISITTTTNKHLEIQICDNGKGMDSLKKGFGLTGLENRVHQVGGTLTIKTAPNQGFAIYASIPLTENVSLQNN